jgi:hypothetical protein
MGLDSAPGAKCEHVYPPARQGVAGEARPRGPRAILQRLTTLTVGLEIATIGSGSPKLCDADGAAWAGSPSPKTPVVEFQGGKQRQCAIERMFYLAQSW